jgi:predicted Rossmann fold nucleotide-binding protein DprA/Smf involved in DNA uptake
MGDPERPVMTVPQLRVLARRVTGRELLGEDRELETADLVALGYSGEMARRILSLLAEEARLDHYLSRGRKLGCTPITRVSDGYPLELRKRLGSDSPGCLWARGDIALLDTPKISLVGSRDLLEANRQFAREVGRQAALQGFTLVSGNARGADRTAQDACLAAGGKVISVVADTLADKHHCPGILYLSEDEFDGEFSPYRALSRNRVIHALGAMTFAAQSSYRTGGTWDGTVKNLRFGWSTVYCFDDGSPAMVELEQMGAQLVGMDALRDICALYEAPRNFLE